MLCLQDPTHASTKLRNRLLSVTAALTIGDQRISLDFLSEMMNSISKLKHGLVKSDVYPRDKQNYASCEKMSRDCVLTALEEIPGSSATRLYLKLIRSVIIAYIDKSTCLKDRIYDAWLCVFLCRMWWSWLLAKAEQDSDEMESWSSNENSSQSVAKLVEQFFITKVSYESIEINAHQLTYLILLVEENVLPPEALQIFLFSSQPCETTFRSARSMSGAFSSIVNFSVTEFLRRAQKLSVLNRIRSESETYSSSANALQLRFVKYHKQMTNARSSSAASITSSITKNEIQKIVSSAFDDAFQLIGEFGVHALMKKKKIHTFWALNRFVSNKLNSLSKTVDTSSMTTTSSESDTDTEYEDDDNDNKVYDAMDEENLSEDSDDESSAY